MALPDFNHTPPVDAVGVEERAARFQARSIKKATKVSAMKLALSMIDLTTLEGQDTPGKVRQLCAKGMRPHPSRPDLPAVACICVYPTLVRVAHEALAGSGLHVASVATAFPSGQAPLKLRLEETRWAVAEGADEIDMVISRGAYLRGEYSRIFDEVAAVKEACGEAHLKVILETGEIGRYTDVRRASNIAMHAGADFIKTSTGKISPAATLPVTLVMLQAIRDFHGRTGRMVGMKPAGGIRDAKTALAYLVAVKETLGPAWLTPDWFRFGASSLANDLLMQIIKQLEGPYQRADAFTED
ncbi:MAG: deoxyribose-phosphate aldolase [Opitutales bacterium]